MGVNISQPQHYQNLFDIKEDTSGILSSCKVDMVNVLAQAAFCLHIQHSKLRHAPHTSSTAIDRPRML